MVLLRRLRMHTALEKNRPKWKRIIRIWNCERRWNKIILTKWKIRRNNERIEWTNNNNNNKLKKQPRPADTALFFFCSLQHANELTNNSNKIITIIIIRRLSKKTLSHFSLPVFELVHVYVANWKVYYAKTVTMVPSHVRLWFLSFEIAIIALLNRHSLTLYFVQFSVCSFHSLLGSEHSVRSSSVVLPVALRSVAHTKHRRVCKQRRHNISFGSIVNVQTLFYLFGRLSLSILI